MGGSQLQDMIEALFWVCLCFLSGSLPLSVWLGRLFLHTDIRKFGDGNPGATNVLRAGGLGVGALAYFLDAFKGALPVGLAYRVFDLEGPGMLLVALAPPLGHAFSPFLRWRGGKALSVTLGVWIGLTLVELPVVILTLVILGYAVLTVEGWAVMLTAFGSGIYLLVARPDLLLFSVLVGHVALLAWTHRHDLRKRPGLRPWIGRILRKKRSSTSQDHPLGKP